MADESFRRFRLGRLCLFACAALLLCAPATAWAGMRAHPVLTDFARLKLQVISFFSAALLLLALGVQFLWNFLRRDFTSLPRLSYGKALGVVALWGLLFILVLAMISGARELMTPGAWEPKPGGGYRLSSSSAQAPAPTESDRRQHLQQLRDELWHYAKANGGNLPPYDFVPDIPGPAWEVPGGSGLRYIYLPGSTAGSGRRVVAYEPGVFGVRRLALFSDGRVELVPLDELREAIREQHLAESVAADQRGTADPAGAARHPATTPAPASGPTPGTEP